MKHRDFVHIRFVCLLETQKKRQREGEIKLQQLNVIIPTRVLKRTISRNHIHYFEDEEEKNKNKNTLTQIKSYTHSTHSHTRRNMQNKKKTSLND